MVLMRWRGSEVAPGAVAFDADCKRLWGTQSQAAMMCPQEGEFRAAGANADGAAGRWGALAYVSACCVRLQHHMP